MIFATNNKGKLREIRSILNQYEVKSLREANVSIEVEENQNSFYGNALKKAMEIYEVVGEPVIADDSGLCITAFNDWPGVLTHRFMGENATDDDRNNAIVEKMSGMTGEEREAKVVCNLVYYDGESVLVGEGILMGSIPTFRRGSNGFGFDDVFELEDGRTLAELTSEEKNNVSARYLAAVDLRNKLEKKENELAALNNGRKLEKTM